MVKPEHFPNLHGMDYFGWLGWMCYSVVWTNHFKSQAEKQVSDLHLQMFLNNLANKESTTFDVDKDFILHPSEPPVVLLLEVSASLFLTGQS